MFSLSATPQTTGIASDNDDFSTIVRLEYSVGRDSETITLAVTD
jgi:hypothetical protein